MNTYKKYPSVFSLGVAMVLYAGLFVLGYFLGQKNFFSSGFLGERPVACTLEAKICPDGTAVGRTGPHCEFAECPRVSRGTSEETKAGTACRVNEDCRCRNFDGAKFLPGTYPGQCDITTKTCRQCLYR
jgi:hypothetical protein